MTGLITVWCVGCASYDPMMGALFGHSTGTSCGAEVSVGGAAASPDASAPVTTASAAVSSDNTLDCGCGAFCHAVSPETWRIVVVAAVTPDANPLRVIAPTSVTRSPLAPPPQAGI